MLATFGDAIPITIAEGATGPEFQPPTLTCAAGASCIWRNETSAAQEVLPLFKGGPLSPMATRLTLARRPGSYVFQLRSNPNAQLIITVTGAASTP